MENLKKLLKDVKLYRKMNINRAKYPNDSLKQDYYGHEIEFPSNITIIDYDASYCDFQAFCQLWYSTLYDCEYYDMIFAEETEEEHCMYYFYEEEEYYELDYNSNDFAYYDNCRPAYHMWDSYYKFVLDMFGVLIKISNLNKDLLSLLDFPF